MVTKVQLGFLNTTTTTPLSPTVPREAPRTPSPPHANPDEGHIPVRQPAPTFIPSPGSVPLPGGEVVPGVCPINQ